MAIHIKESHKGLLHQDLGIPEGKKIKASRLSRAKKSAKKRGDTAEEKRIVFTQNARDWEH